MVLRVDTALTPCRIQPVYPFEEEPLDDGVGAWAILGRFVLLVGKLYKVDQTGEGFIHDTPLCGSGGIDEVVAAVEPLQNAIGCPEDREQPSQGSNPRARGFGVALDLLVEYGYQLGLEAIGDGFVIFLVLPHIGGDGVDELVGEREGGFAEKGADGLAKVFQRAVVSSKSALCRLGERQLQPWELLLCAAKEFFPCPMAADDDAPCR